MVRGIALVAALAILVGGAAAASTTKKTTSTKQTTTTSAMMMTTTMISTTMPMTATTTTIVKTKVSGTMSATFPDGINQTQIEEGAKVTVGKHFDVDPKLVNAGATSARRLDAVPRHLAAAWDIAYDFLAPPEKLAAINVKVSAAASDPDAFKAAIATGFKEGLIAAGVDASLANAMVVNSIATPAAISQGATTTTAAIVAPGVTIDPDLALFTDGARQTAASILVVTAIKMLF